MDAFDPLLEPKRLRNLISNWHVDCGQRLRTRRVALGISQEQLANLVGMTVTSISRCESGLQAPRDAIRYSIACSLLCEVDDIWPRLDRSYVTMMTRAAA
jgi:DNA-binding XRE family transcriptional regulator